MAGCFGKRKKKPGKKHGDHGNIISSQGHSTKYPSVPESKKSSHAERKDKHLLDSRIPATDLNSNFLQSPRQPNAIKTEKQSQQSSSEVHQNPKSAKTSKAQQFVNIGIYMDESQIFVGTTDPDKIQPKLLLQHPGQLTLLEDHVEIGKRIETTRKKYEFSLYELLKYDVSCEYTIQFSNITTCITQEELLVLFLKKLLFQIKASIKDGTLGNVIVSTAFLLNSLEKQRLSLALTAAKIHPTRIVSSLLTTAIAEATYNRVYARSKNDHEFVVVVHPLSQSFSMAVVEIGKDYISMRRCVGSQNFELPFNKQNALALYETGLQDLLHIQDFECKKILEVSKLEPVPLVGKTSFGMQMSVTSVATFLGPFAGACFLACSNFMPQLKLLPNILVQDASVSDLFVRLSSWHNARQVPFKHTAFLRRTVFQDKVTVPTEGISMSLFEHFRKGYSTQVAAFQIVGTGWSNEAFVQVLVSQDGIFSVTSKDATVTWVNEFSHKKATGQMQMQKLSEYYSNYRIDGRSSKKINDIRSSKNEAQNSGRKHVSGPNGSTLVQLAKHNFDPSEMIQKVMDAAFEDGLQQHKQLMLRIADRKEPVKRSEIVQYHEKCMAEIIKAFDASLGILTKTHLSAVTSTKERLMEKMNFQLSIYVMRYEVEIEKVARKLQLAKLNN